VARFPTRNGSSRAGVGKSALPPPSLPSLPHTHTPRPRSPPLTCSLRRLHCTYRITVRSLLPAPPSPHSPGCSDDGTSECGCASAPTLPSPSFEAPSGRAYYNIKLDVATPPSKKNIEKQCNALGLQPVCAHVSYNDGRCYGEDGDTTSVLQKNHPGAWFVLDHCADWRYNVANYDQNGKHQSYLNFHQFAKGCNPPSGQCGDTYCSDEAAGGFILDDVTGKQTRAQVVGTAVCTAQYEWTSIVDTATPYFNKWGRDFFVVSSAKMDAGSIVDACKARGMTPMCRNRWWTSRTGTAQECWLPEAKAELVVPAALPKSIVGLYTYIGSIHGGSMLQSGTKKVGYKGAESRGSTLCVA